MMHSSSIEQSVCQETRTAAWTRSTVIIVVDVSVAAKSLTPECRSIWRRVICAGVIIIARIWCMSIIRTRPVVAGTVRRLLVRVAARSTSCITRVVSWWIIVAGWISWWCICARNWTTWQAWIWWRWTYGAASSWPRVGCLSIADIPTDRLCVARCAYINVIAIALNWV